MSQVDSELEIKPYYAGHVLGAAMFHVKVGSQSVIYTVSSELHSLTHSLTHSVIHAGPRGRIFMASTIFLHVFRSISFFTLCIYVVAGLPFLDGPWAGCHKIVLNAI